ncbi:hypothetical protein ACWIGI_25185 [Nocardia sp. NPDC055321]
MNSYPGAGGGGPHWNPAPGQPYPAPQPHWPPAAPPRPPATPPGSTRRWVVPVIIAGAVAIGGFTLWRGITNDDRRTDVSVSELRMGDCIDIHGDGQELTLVVRRNCVKPHEAEVLYRGAVDISGGEATARPDAHAQCETHARPLLTAAGLEDSVELQVYYSPDKAKSYKDFEGVLCLAVGKSSLTAQIWKK